MHQLTRAAITAMLAFTAVASVAAQGDRGSAGTGTGTQNATESENKIGAAGSGSYAFRLSYYENSDAPGDGNPFLDEDLQVLEPILYFDYNVTNQTQLWGQFSYDQVSSASIDRLSKFSQQSGASGDYYVGLDLGLQSKVSDDTTIGGFIGASFEYDYRSFGLGGNILREFDGGNSSIKGSLTGYFDNLDVIRFDGTEGSSDDRLSVSGVLSYYRTLNPTTHGEFGLSLTHQSGFLETPYNAVVLENPADPPNPNLFNMARGTEFFEELPNSRLRASLFGRVRKSMSDSYALELAGRLYGDDWGITSVTLEPRILFWLARDRLRASAHYRFYTQTAADDYQNNFTGPTLPTHRTQDSDLADLVTHGIGLRLDYYYSATTTIDFGVDYTNRDDGLDFLFATFGFAHRF